VILLGYKRFFFWCRIIRIQWKNHKMLGVKAREEMFMLGFLSIYDNTFLSLPLGANFTKKIKEK
jgi:hypothetical protein